MTGTDDYNRAYKRSPNYYGIDKMDESWMSEGACSKSNDTETRKYMSTIFYNERNQSKTLAAKRFCASCPVRQECLDYALAVPHDNGVWGGLTPRERFKVRRGHGTPDQFWSRVLPITTS
jgi:WhiB family redox-sensing transcriptional regulator